MQTVHPIGCHWWRCEIQPASQPAQWHWQWAGISLPMNDIGLQTYGNIRSLSDLFQAIYKRSHGGVTTVSDLPPRIIMSKNRKIGSFDDPEIKWIEWSTCGHWDLFENFKTGIEYNPAKFDKLQWSYCLSTLQNRHSSSEMQWWQCRSKSYLRWGWMF